MFRAALLLAVVIVVLLSSSREAPVLQADQSVAGAVQLDARGLAPVASASSVAHIDASVVGRFPLGYAGAAITDNIVFTGDAQAGILIQVSGAQLLDKWRFRFNRPGGVSMVDCYFQIAPAGATGNTSGVTALIQNCTASQSLVTTSYTYVNGCPCAFDFIGGAFRIVGAASASFPGTWTGVIDFTDGAGITTPAVVQEDIFLVRTPLVALLHGFNSSCPGIAALELNLEAELKIAADRVRCYPYDFEDGISAAAGGLGEWLRDFVRQVDPGHSEVDIVAHSQGGLVARYYYEEDYSALLDPAIGSIAMAGTPNEGVEIAKLERWLCPWYVRVVPVLNKGCDVLNVLVPVDLHSQTIDDFKPSSDILDTLNDDFLLPAYPVYRAHAGLKTTWLGKLVSGAGFNDCFISRDSTFGPGDVFGLASPYEPGQYTGVSHAGGFLLCDGSNTLTNNLAVVQNMLPDVKPFLGFPSGASGAAAATAVAPAADLAAPILRIVDAGVTDGIVNTHVFSIPPGTPNATFGAFWLGGNNPADLAVEVRRPGGLAVSGVESDVVETITLDGSPGSFYLTGRGFTLANPSAGDWTIRVTGITTNGGAPYFAGVFPESQVALSATIGSDTVLLGTPQLIEVQLEEDGAPINATVSARLLNIDGSEQVVPLVDDGTNGDTTAGDNRYSHTIPTTGLCGTVRLHVSAEAASSSEGAVHREQLASFDVNIAGDATRDPCDPDDDDDGLTDYAELKAHGTNPVNPDSDKDLLSDPDELDGGSNPQDPDTDEDGVLDGAEAPQGTSPTDPDSDGDGRMDLIPSAHGGPANTSLSADNCPSVANANQLNNDGNHIDTSPPRPPNLDDKTRANSDALGDACDLDDDNDGLPDTVETAGAPCASATAPTNPLSADSDGDRVLDGAECLLGTNPASAVSVPAYVVEPDAENDGVPDAFDPNDAASDSDGDGVLDRAEFRNYNTDLSSANGDGDICTDAKEIASVDGNTDSNVIDLGIIAGAAGPSTGPTYHVNFDLNKNGSIDVIDLSLATAQQGLCTQT